MIDLDINLLVHQVKPLLPTEELKRLLIFARDGDTVDLKVIVEHLQVEITLSDDFREWGHIRKISGSDRAAVELKRSNTSAMNRTILALALADYLLTPRRLNLHGLSYDMFSINDMYSQSRGARMMLATRLVMPEKIIYQVNQQGFPLIDYSEANQLIPEFVRSSLPAAAAARALKNQRSNMSIVV
jgi:hypothetical protein